MLRHDLQPVGEVLKRPPTNRGSATSNSAFPPEDPLFPSANSLSTTTQHQEYTSRLASDLLGKYNRVDFPPPLYQQDIWYPGNLLEVIKFILSIECPPMQEPEFQFQFSQEAAHHNWDTLSKYDNLGQALEATSNTQLSYGSEFRDPNLLQLIFLNHPLWKCLKQQLQEGVSYPSIELPENASRQDLLDAFEFGNHKGVGKNKEFFQNAMKEEVLCGWQLPIPRQKVLLIKGALMSPMNVVEQKSINEKGEIIDKQRLTHDQGMKFSSGTSVNSRVIEEEIQDPMYGFCLLRIIHTIIDFRLRFPSKRIFMNKIDYKAAYRRSHLNWKLAIQTITQCTDSNLAFIALRMTFGGAPNPSFWGNISESVIDLANALLQCKEWDPSTLHSPLQHRLPTEPKQSPNSKLATALPIDVDVLPSDNGKADIYIDDGITITVEKDDEDLSNLNKAAAAVLLAMHVVGRPDDEKDPIKRKNLCSLSKLAAEGTLAEMLVILGWQIDSRLLLVILPYDKFKAWTTSIEQMISSKRSSFKELESTVGRLGHVTFIIPYMKHFMSRIRAKMKQAQNRRHIKLNSEVVEDLKLHLQFLKFAHEGINMNLITFRKVTHVYRTDACPFGIGGYSHKGRAWRFYIPKNLQFRMTLNMLEFVASIISPWVDILEGNLPPFSCILSLTDSSTTAGWLHKSNFQESETEHPSLSQAKLKLARDHALRIFTQQCKDYSQWFPGDENDLADSLSRDFHFSNEFLTSLYHDKIPEQTPKNLQISPLPQEIESYLYSMLQSLPENTQQHERHKMSSIALGLVGNNSSRKLASQRTTSSSTNFRNNTEQSSYQHSSKLSEIDIFLQTLASPWSARLSELPWTTYARPSETTTDQIQNSTQTRSLADFYNSSSKAIKTKTHQKNTKKQSL